MPELHCGDYYFLVGCMLHFETWHGASIHVTGEIAAYRRWHFIRPCFLFARFAGAPHVAIILVSLFVIGDRVFLPEGGCTVARR